MASKIRIRRGLKAQLPVLDIGELGFCTDTKEIYVGSAEGNQLVGETGIIKFNTIAELEAAYPNGLDVPVWIVETKSWYYWEGTVIQPPADTTAPNNVTNLGTSNITATSLTLTWTASNSTDVSGYEVYRGTTLLTTTTSTTYNASGLTASTAYTFTVKAKDGAGNVASGASVNATTSAVVDTTPPSNVTNLIANNITATTLTLSWTASSSGDVAGYEVYNGTTLLSTVAVTSYNVTGLTAETAYTFNVKAKDGAGNVASGASVNATTTAQADTTPPTVTINPAGGTYTTAQSVTLTVNETATIYYTIDGSTPTTSSTQYTTPINISATTTLKYFARDTAGNNSTVQTVNYTINTVPADTYSLSFNGTTSIATSASNVGITGNQARTIEVRFRTSDLAVNQTILQWGTASGYQANSIALYNQKIMLRDGTSFVDSYASTITPLASNTWYHVVFTYDGTNQFWYLDGIKKRGPETYPNSTPVAMSTTATAMKFGSGSSGYLKGDIDFVRIYDRALTATEVTNNKNGTVVRTGLVNEWLINAGSGTTLADTAGTNNMTATDTSWVSNS